MTLRSSLIFILTFAVLLLHSACSSSIRLGDADGGTDANPVEDAGFVDTRDAATEPNAGTDAGTEDLCGFTFEHRAPAPISHVWASSPTDQWLVRNSRFIERSDGTSMRRVAVPEQPGVASFYITALEGAVTGGPWLVVGQWLSPGQARWALFRWDGTDWQAVPMPDLRPDTTSTDRQDVNGLVVLGTDDVWMLGGQSGPPSEVTTAIHHWNGAEWTAHAIEGTRLFGLAPAGGGKIMVGATQPFGVQIEFLWGNSDSLVPIPARPVYDGAGSQSAPFLFYAESAPGAEGYWVDTVGRVWDGESWVSTLVSDGDEEFLARPSASGHRSALGAGFFDEALWIMKKEAAVRIADPTDPSAFTVHPFPFRAIDVAFPGEGPPWIVGSDKAFWNGVEWQVQGEATNRLYDQFGGVYGEAADDYWVWGNPSTGSPRAVHVHDGVAEFKTPPEACLGRDTRVSDVFGVGSDLFFSTCRGTERFRDGRYHDIVLALPSSVWGLDLEHLFAFGDGARRFDGSTFVPLTPDDWAEGSEPANFFLPPIVGLTDGDSSGHLYSIAAFQDRRAIAHFDGEFFSEVSLPEAFERASAGSILFSMHSAGESLFAAGYVSDDDGTPLGRLGAWSWDGSRWTARDLDDTDVAPANFSFPRNLHIDGRGDEVWIITRDRYIYRRQSDGEWLRDDRCISAPGLEELEFQHVWFPPEGPPKIFATGGNVLVYNEGPR